MSDEPIASGPDPVERLMIECLAVPEPEQASALARACADHPELAPGLRRRFAHLQELGLRTPAVAAADPLPERLGEFRLLERLGQGGMGVVYRAEQESLRREVAIKLIRPERLYFPGSRALFVREVQAVARMQHPGIVPIHVVGEAGGIPFYAMELVRGRSLAATLTECQGSPALPAGDRLLPGSARNWVDTCCEIARQVAMALEHAHARDVVHRDVKPSNVMLADDGRALLVDFGLASHGGGERITRSGSQPGSLGYMSPEQVRGERVDRRTDVYSLGVTLYEMLALSPAFAGDTDASIRRRIEHGEVVPLHSVRRGLPWDVVTVCATAMAPEPGQRYATAAAFAADLQALLDRRPIAARRPGIGLRVRRFAQRRPALAAALALAAVLLVGGPVALLWQEHAARKVIQQEAAIARQVTDFLLDLFTFGDPHHALGEDVRVRTLVDQARRRLQHGGVSDPRVRAELLETLGRVYAGLHRPADAVELLTEARQLHAGPEPSATRELAETTTVLGLAEGLDGNLDAAERHLREALAMLRASEPPDPAATATCLAELAEILHKRAKADEARESFDEALVLARTAGPADSRATVNVLHRRGRFLLATAGPAAAEPDLREAVAIQDRALPAASIEKVMPLSTLGFCLHQLGQRESATATLQAALDLALHFYGDRHPLTAGIQVQKATALSAAGELESAAALLDEALSTYRDVGVASAVAVGLAEAQLGITRARQGRQPEGRAALERAIDEFAGAGEAGHADLLEVQLTLGKLLLAAGDTKAAEQRLRAAADLGESLGPAHARNAAVAQSTLARALAAGGRTQDAVALAAAATARLEAAGLAETPAMGDALENHAQALVLAGDAAQALAVAERLVTLLRRLGPEADLAEALCLRSMAHDKAGNLEPAAEDAAAALALARRAFDGTSTRLIAPLRQAARMTGKKGEHARALELLGEAAAIARQFTGGAGETWSYMLTCYAAACLDAGNRDEALGHASDSLRVLEEAQASGGPPAIALVELLVRLLEDGAAFEPERVQKAAARWLPPQHALWPRLRAATDAAPAKRD